MIGGLKKITIFSAHAIDNKDESTIIYYFTRYFTRYATGYPPASNLSYTVHIVSRSRYTLCYSMSTAQMDRTSVCWVGLHRFISRLLGERGRELGLSHRCPSSTHHGTWRRPIGSR